MKTIHVLFSSLFVASALARPTPTLLKRDVDPDLVPDLGLQAGLNPTGTGDCDGIPGANGVPIKIPCSCPPSRDVLLKALNANVAAGHAVNNPSVKVTFPTDNSTQSQQDRITAVVITLQNLDGPGKGCPTASTTLTAQSKAIQDAANKASASPSQPQPQPSSSSSAPSQPSSVPPPSPPPAAPAAPSPSPSLAIDPALVPDLGLKSGINPTGTGDCDGIPGPDGVPIKIPCQCPPDRTKFLNALSANVAAGQAVNNPSVKVTFPIDNSTGSQEARITAMSITLQNLDGPGKGCPIASTTLAAQAKAIQDAASSSSAVTAPSSTPSPAPVSTSAPVQTSSTTSSAAPAKTSSSSGAVASSGSSNLSNAPPAAPAPASGDSCTATSSGTSSSSTQQSQSVNLSNSKNNGNNNSNVNNALPTTNVTLDPELVPDLGGTAGKNPTGTGDCDGVVKQANGQPIKVPCSCPPDRDSFIAALNANVAVGHAVNNPSVSVSFPTDSSPNAQFERIEAAIVTLQNLHGPGQGCPVASTTLGQQQADILTEINHSR